MGKKSDVNRKSDFRKINRKIDSKFTPSDEFIVKHNTRNLIELIMSC